MAKPVPMIVKIKVPEIGEMFFVIYIPSPVAALIAILAILLPYIAKLAQRYLLKSSYEPK